ncbi:MAG TPA: hypothetical protein VIU11_15135 [Nakamurella sp.]
MVRLTTNDLRTRQAAAWALEGALGDWADPQAWPGPLARPDAGAGPGS